MPITVPADIVATDDAWPAAVQPLLNEELGAFALLPSFPVYQRFYVQFVYRFIQNGRRNLMNLISNLRYFDC